ncbi:MAG TPA: ATP-dependent Clp protease adapter ClpS [Aeromonadales bacterium]|nr:ATP-dependent Clp protease adapter ClpS [Aeromonadales bacterium]
MTFRQNDNFSTKLSSEDTDSSKPDAHHEDGLVVQEAMPELKEPPMYQVVLLNDDFTPMEFVVEVLLKFFSKDKVQATQIMLQVHHEGKGICGKYTCEIAETKVNQVNEYSRENSHPLMTIMEKSE